MPPEYSAGAEDMDSSYAEAPVTPPGKSKADAESVDEQNAGEETAVISNNILSPDGEPLKEGDEVVLQVVKNYGEECSVKYAPKEGAGAEEPAEGSMEQAGKELAALDTGE